MFFKRGFRWLLFMIAALSFLYVIFIRVSTAGVCVFLIAGAAWFWLERRKMTELDAARWHKGRA